MNFQRKLKGNPFAAGAGHIEHYGYNEGHGYGYGQYYGHHLGGSYPDSLPFHFVTGDGYKYYPWMLVQYWKN